MVVRIRTLASDAVGFRPQRPPQCGSTSASCANKLTASFGVRPTQMRKSVKDIAERLRHGRTIKKKKKKSSSRQRTGDINDTNRELQPMHPHVFTPTPKNNSTRSLNWKSSSSQQTPHLSAHRCNNGMQKKRQKQTVDTDRTPKFGNGPLRRSTQKKIIRNSTKSTSHSMLRHRTNE